MLIKPLLTDELQDLWQKQQRFFSHIRQICTLIVNLSAFFLDGIPPLIQDRIDHHISREEAFRLQLLRIMTQLRQKLPDLRLLPKCIICISLRQLFFNIFNLLQDIFSQTLLYGRILRQDCLIGFTKAKLLLQIRPPLVFSALPVPEPDTEPDRMKDSSRKT